jgi:GTP-binding protein
MKRSLRIYNHEKFIGKGGPDGGSDGGRHVYIRGNKSLWTLFSSKICKHMRGGHGGDGGSSRSTGHDEKINCRSTWELRLKI